MEITMNTQDSVRGGSGRAFISLETERYLFAQVINIDTDFDIKMSEIPIMGRTSAGNTPGIIKYKGTATFHFNTSVFREILKKYQDEGIVIYFDIQIVNEGKNSNVGSQAIILKNCFINSGKLAKLDASAEYLEDTFSFTFDRFEMPKTFNILAEMQA